MPCVAHPIHEPEGLLCQQTVSKMVLDDEVVPSDPSGFREQLPRVGTVVDGIHHEDDIHRLIVFGQVQAVVFHHFDLRIGSEQHVRASDDEIGSQGTQSSSQAAVAAAYIQYGDGLGHEFRQLMGEDPRAPFGHVSVMESFEPAQRRSIPRRLVKNPERMVWKPKAARVTPGITPRRVAA